MIVELIGPSGAGKSTLLHAVADAIGPTRRVVPWTALVTDRPGRRGIRDPHAVNLLADASALLPFLGSLPRHAAFVRFAFGRLARHAPSMFAMANYARNIVRKVGVFELARRADPATIHLFDEGPILSAYQLFVYSRAPAAPTDLARFARLAPLPDLVVHVRAPLERLVRRAGARADPRRELAGTDDRSLRQRLVRATELFDALAELEPIRDRTVTVQLADDRAATLAAAVDRVRSALPSAEERAAASERSPRGTPDRHATVVAFVGSEATGKSTVLGEIERRFAGRHPVRRVHAGKPPSTALTVVPHVLLPAFRKLFPEQRTLRVEERNERDGDGDRGFPLLFGIRSVMLAYERRALLRRAASAGRGTIVLSDRYPSSTSGAPDGPQLAHLVEREGRRSVRRTLARIEERLYRDVPTPDVVFHLTAPLDVVLARNAGRAKREPEEYVRFRHALSSTLRFDGVPVHRVDTDRALEVVVEEIEEVIRDGGPAAG